MATRSETALRNRRFNELVEKLSASIPTLKERCIQLSTYDLTVMHPKDLLAQLEVLRCDAASLEGDVSNLKESGEELMSILEALDCADTPKAKSIIRNLENITRNFVDLTSLISEKQTHFEQLLAEYEATRSERQSLWLWIQEILTSTGAEGDPSLDLSVLEEQVNANHRVLVEVLTREPHAKLVTQRCQVFGICDGTSDVAEKFQELVAQVNARDQRLRNILSKLSTLKRELEGIAAWISNACLLLESPNKNGMLHTWLDELYHERLEKEKSLERIRKIGKELASDSGCSDSGFLRDSLADLQSNWRRLSDLIIAAMSSVVKTDMKEFSSFAVRLEKHFTQKEIVRVDPEEAAVRLSYHKVLYEELSAKKSQVDRLSGQFDHLLRDRISPSHNEITGEITSLQKHLLAISRLAETRITTFNEMLPLISQLQTTYSDLSSGFMDIQRDINSLDIEHSESTEHIRINQYKLKLIHQFLEGHQMTVNDAVSVGHELQSVSSDCDCSQAIRLVNDITDKCEAVKQSLKKKSVAQEEAFRRAFTDVNETILELQSRARSLSDRILFADNVAANIFVLNQQLTENKDVVSDLDHLKLLINETAKRVENLTVSNAEEIQDNTKRSEIQLQLEDLEALHSNAEFAAHQRTDFILVVLCAAEKFFFDFLAVSENLHDLRDRLASQKAPALSPEAVQQQQKDLESIKNDLENVSQQMERCLETSAPALEALGAADADREIKKCSDDFEDLQDEIGDGIRTRSSDLETAFEVAENFAGYSKSVLSWLPEAEAKTRSMTPIADTPRAVRIQIEEFKVFKVQMYQWYLDIHRLSQSLGEMSITSPEAVKSFAAHFRDVNDRWQEIVRLANQREEDLRNALIELGEIDDAVEDVLGLLQQIESDLVHFNEVYGDARHIELHLKKVETLLKDIASQKPIIRRLGESIEMVIKRSGRTNSPLAERQQEMTSLFGEIQANARDRRDELLDRLKEVKCFVGSVDETIRWLNNFKSQLKISSPMGALLDTVHLQYNKIMMAYQDLETKEVEVKAILLNGEDMFFRCQQNEGSNLNKKLNQLRILLNEAKAKVKLIKNKIEDHIEKVEKFHGEFSSQTKWLNGMERRLRSFRHPSKLVDRVEHQMQQLLECETDIKAHAESMKAVDQNGTYLKYFGPKQDTVYIKSLLMSTSIRWKKLQQTADEAHRILEHACSENKRFLDSWKTLCDWMNEAEGRLLHKVMIGQSARTKQDLDELKRFDLQMSSKQPLYCITRRQGVSMRDRCTKSDPDKVVIGDMIEELSSKWNQLRSLVMHRQEKVDDCLLLSPGHCSDTLDSMLGWLKKSEIYLSDKQLILGDINTVTLLMDQLKEFQQELFRRMDIIQKIPEAIPSGPSDLSGQLQKVKMTLEQVNHLNNLRQASLHEALKLAEDFNESLDDIQKWLPVAEAELKFRSIPNDEDGIIRLIENHEKFHEDLLGQEPNIEKMMYVAEEILVSCHPKAVSIIKYHMTIMQTRWQQALRRSKARSERLQEALNDVRRSATLEEELAVWLREAENHLKEKEREALPSDRASIEASLREQTQFHRKLCSRSKDIDKLFRLSIGSLQNICKMSSSSLTLTPQRQKEISPSDNNVGAEFRQKWQMLWQQSADRKKLLEDLVEQLAQAERGECFDFDRWRVIAQDWFRARKLRIGDVFSHQDRNSRGLVTKKQFVDGMLAAKFPSTAADLRTIFDILDSTHAGAVNYREIVKTILSDYQSIPSREIPNLNESELIREELRQQLSRCQCFIPFVMQRIDDNKFKFGDRGKLCLVRFVNSSITVRVGGGWMTISEFMDNFDPCRIKQRPSPKAGLISPPERSFSSRGGGRGSPPDTTGLASVNKISNLATIKGQRCGVFTNNV